MLMSTRSVGLLLGLGLLIAVATLVQDYRFDQLMAGERSATIAAEREFGAIEAAIAGVRTAQAGYVALGQAPAAWMTRANELLAQLDTLVAARRTASRLDDAEAPYNRITQAKAEFSKIDRQARAAVERDDRFPASDLIFMDASAAADRLTDAVAQVRALEAEESSRHTSRLAMLRLVINGAAVLLVLAIAAYFGRAARVLSATPPSVAEMLKNLAPPVKNGGAQTAVPTPAAAAPVVPAPAVAAPRLASLSAAADLCVDLARVLDGRDVPALLERAATLLDAKGIMLWAADADGALLRPAACHGYGDKVLAKLKPLQVDSDNVTSLAFRSLQPQSIGGAAAADSGALAVPLLTPTGCVGVLAAETRQSRPHPDLIPLARIIAAQFSTLVAPAEAGEVRKTAQG
jgi:hypothetical protein